MTDLPIPALLQRKQSNAAVTLADIAADALPDAARALLDHSEHMTHVQERRHNTRIRLEVLGVETDDRHYVREVLLGPAGGAPSLYAILDVNLTLIPDDVRSALVAAERPFGEILGDSGLERRIEVRRFVKATLDEATRRQVGQSRATAFGREIIIHCNGQPAIAVLEILVNEP